MLSTIVDTDALWRIVVIGFAGGAGIVAVFSVLLLAETRMADARERGDTAALAGLGLVVALCAVACVGALVIGFVAMTKKS